MLTQSKHALELTKAAEMTVSTVHQLMIKSHASNAIMDLSDSREELVLTRDGGHSAADEEREEEICVVGLPMINARGRPVATVCVAALAFQSSLEELEIYLPLLRGAAWEIGVRSPRSNDPARKWRRRKIIDGVSVDGVASAGSMPAGEGGGAVPRHGKKPILRPAEAANLVGDGRTLFVGGSGGGIQEPTALLEALGERFARTGTPNGITVWHCSGVGDRKGSGLALIAHEKMLKRVVGGHWGMAPAMAAMALEGRIEAYNFPQGAISQLMREVAGGRPGLLTPIGVGTFVDPRLEGGRLNERTTEELVHVVEFGGQECLFYPSFGVDVAFIRATTADELGNLTFEEEAAFLEALSVAQAARASGGRVVAQVKYLAEAGTLHPQRVKVPGVVVDAIAVVSDQRQTCLRDYDPALSGAVKTPVSGLTKMEPGARKVVARRAALEIRAGSVVNLGVGIPDGIASIAAEEGFLEDLTFAIEHGHVGGIPEPGVEFGAAVNPLATLDAPYQFDYFGGGGLDVAFLGMAQADAEGNVNVSRYGDVLSGCGGFIDITQGTRHVVFCGTFTAGGLEVEADGGRLRIVRDGRHPKFVERVEQVTFSGKLARKRGQEVLYVTERAVFRLGDKGMDLVEVAPGIDLEADVLGKMAFCPGTDGVEEMPTALFGAKHEGRGSARPVSL